jgi:hypothetical protein
MLSTTIATFQPESSNAEKVSCKVRPRFNEETMYEKHANVILKQYYCNNSNSNNSNNIKQ